MRSFNATPLLSHSIVIECSSLFPLFPELWVHPRFFLFGGGAESICQIVRAFQSSPTSHSLRKPRRRRPSSIFFSYSFYHWLIDDRLLPGKLTAPELLERCILVLYSFFLTCFHLVGLGPFLPVIILYILYFVVC